MVSDPVVSAVAPAGGRPGARPGRSLRSVRAPLALAAVGLALAAVLRIRDPHGAGSYGQCALLRLTGIPCPACGGLRAVNDLTHGEVLQALSSNAYVVLSAAAVLGWWFLWVRRRLSGRGAPLADRSTTVAVLWGVGFVAFGALRLLPSLAWLRP